MAETVFTHGAFTVREGEEQAFLASYRRFLDHVGQLEGVRDGRLLQRLQAPMTYYSFGEWESLEHASAMRDDQVQALLADMAACCEETTTGPCRVVEVP